MVMRKTERNVSDRTGGIRKHKEAVMRRCNDGDIQRGYTKGLRRK
jgi:hypothetical protein